MKGLIVGLLVLLATLQWRLWLGDGSYRDVMHYRQEVDVLAETLASQQDINNALSAEVDDLKDGLGEIEARARAELGMIRDDEVFYQFVGETRAPSDAAFADTVAGATSIRSQ